jgi:hypothetical protein
MPTFRIRGRIAALAAATIGFAVLVSCNNRPIQTPTSAPPATESNPVENTPTTPAPKSAEATQEPLKSTNTPLPAPTLGAYLPAVPVWGIELYHLSSDGGLDMIQQAGAYWVRRNALIWSDVEPSEGARNWEALAGLESELKTAAVQGLQVILVVRSTPEWAQSTAGSLCSPPKPEKLAAFAALMHDVVRRYSIPPYNVQYWEISNEPDVAPEWVPSDAVFGCWGLTGDPYYGGRYYADILKAVYPQVKSANPQAQVLVGGLLLNCDPVNPPETETGSGQQKDCTPSRYLEGALINGGGSYFDGISYHAYDYYGGGLGKYSNANWNSAWNSTGPTLIAKADYLRGVLNLYGITGKYLMNTEAALLCGKDGTEPVCQSEKFLLTKSYYLVQTYVSAIAEHLTANVWYSLTGWRASGLVEPGMQTNPSFEAFKTNVAQLSGTGYLGPITDYPGVRGYAFERKGAPVWVLWSLDGEKHPIQLDQVPKSITDTFGAQVDVSQDMTITMAPIYLEFSK